MRTAIEVLALSLLAIWIGDYKVAMSLTIYPLAFKDNSITLDVSASPVLSAIFKPALVQTANRSDEEAFTVGFLRTSENLADVLAFTPATDEDV